MLAPDLRGRCVSDLVPLAQEPGRVYAEMSGDLQRALQGRHTIALASGILMEHHHLDEDQAFLRLVRDAGRVPRGLLDEARDVVRSASSTSS